MQRLSGLAGVSYSNMQGHINHKAWDLEIVFTRLGPGVRYSEFAVSHPKPPPLVGQHTVEILKGMLGYEDDAIEELLRTGAVAQHEARWPWDSSDVSQVYHENGIMKQSLYKTRHGQSKREKENKKKREKGKKKTTQKKGREEKIKEGKRKRKKKDKDKKEVKRSKNGEEQREEEKKKKN
ncbi:succinate--hydroxymethylglutarate -transferase [Limosa lapponica baueri]|uniref:Succinate--hydroxymethylglutarate-transferase n=1 Tax=Limosa lapponica baueri TaxID=1758121 RepID=A0A2I0TX17_LIMLA|nr:succinate--hydroxymethylglutarate -transferase [Limosa lapponica baueri]